MDRGFIAKVSVLHNKQKFSALETVAGETLPPRFETNSPESVITAVDTSTTAASCRRKCAINFSAFSPLRADSVLRTLDFASVPTMRSELSSKIGTNFSVGCACVPTAVNHFFALFVDTVPASEFSPGKFAKNSPVTILAVGTVHGDDIPSDI